jgi:hypothetical protein
MFWFCIEIKQQFYVYSVNFLIINKMKAKPLKKLDFPDLGVIVELCHQLKIAWWQ